MFSDNRETKLATEYETLRRREYEVISRLLEVLPGIDNLEAERLSHARDALFHADHPFLAMLVGPFNSGKTSLINALLGEADLLPVSPIPTTDRICILRAGDHVQRMNSGGEIDTLFHPAPLLQKLSLVDTPGLESVFQKHEAATRKFLHRADLVLLVMLATQAMTASNLEYLQKLKEYGKKIILVINQADLLSDEEREAVRQYVSDQSQARLGFKPDIWMVSAKQGQAAWHDGVRDEAAWKASGLDKIDQYIAEQVSDVARLKQKLQTPLQILQNVNQAAQNAVRTNQSTLDHYQSISTNVERQLSAQKRELERVVGDVQAQVDERFKRAAVNGTLAIDELFRLGAVGAALLGGALELVGLGRLTRRRDGVTLVRGAFERHKAFVPLAELPEVVDGLAPRLEGKDLQDADDLVKYAKKEIAALPPSIQSKVIGNVQAGVNYDRKALSEVRTALSVIEDEAQRDETERIDHALSGARVYFVVWEAVLLVFMIFMLLGGSHLWPSESSAPVFVYAGLLLLMLLGILLLPIRGRMLRTEYAGRLRGLQARYSETLGKAAGRQIEYGLRLRRDSIQPLTRLIDAQTQTQTEQAEVLQKAEQEMVGIEKALAEMGRR